MYSPRRYDSATGKYETVQSPISPRAKERI